MKNLKIALFIFALMTAFIKVEAADGQVAIDGETLPAADLYSPELGPIDSEQAFELKEEGVDLSKLSPVVSNLWNGKDNFYHYQQDQNVVISNNDSLSFSGVISSPEGVLRFNATNSEGTFQVHLSKTLHTILLRKNLLRKLGYIVPESKYLNNIRINFSDEKQKIFFKDIELVSKLGASYKNWLVEEGDSYLILKDIYVRHPKEDDFYDVALTSMNDTKDLRTLRALIVVYSYLNLDESINKFSFNFLKIRNGHLQFDYPTGTDFDATIEDVKWIGQLIAKLGREDITNIVKESYFPEIVEKLLIEKLIARRNNLVDILKIDASSLQFTKDIEHEYVKDGFLIPHAFEGYAGQFSFGASQSPMDDLPSFIFAEGQSMGLKALMGKVSKYLDFSNITEAKVKWLQEDFESNKDFALDYFDQHGEFPPLPFSSWKAAVVRGNIVFGRDVVVGQNFGTDNFVQLADTIGLTTNLGAFIGLERFGSQFTSGNLMPNIGLNTSYTHVRPVEDLRQAVKTPYKNMLVGNTLRDLEDKLMDYAKTYNSQEQEDRKIRLNEIYNEISQSIGIGESIIISTSIVPDMTLSLSAPLFGVANGYGSISKKYRELSRIHITRKSKYNFQVYYDGAKVNEVRVRGGISYLIPLIMAEGKDIKSKLDMKLYEINLDPNQDDIDFSRSVAKLISLLKDRNNESLGEEDIQIFNKSRDSGFNFNILFFVKKSLKSISEIFVDIKNKVKLKLVSASYGEMDGINMMSFGQNLASFLLKEVVGRLGLENIPMIPEAKHYYKNPGKNFFGGAVTYETTFESKLLDEDGDIGFDNMGELYIYYRKTQEKAVIKEKKIKKYLLKENDAFNLDFYSKSDAKDAGNMHFARLETKIHFFDSAVKRIIAISDRELGQLSHNMKKRICRNRNTGQTLSARLRCGDLDVIKDKLYWCNKYFKKNKKDKGLKCISHVAHYFARYIDARTLLNFFGEDNMYIESQLSGYRLESELMVKPIVGNSYGKINTRNFGGPINKLVTVLNLIKAEVMGYWYRETLK